MSPSTITESREQLVVDMKAVIADAQELLEATTSATGDRVRAARARAEETIRSARQRVADLEVVDQAKEAARSADEYVREHPWGAVGVAAAVGLLVGVLVARR
jgi:ElaB/YqjD/DUF883 family membrane-anchored ribosome-binding protein